MLQPKFCAQEITGGVILTDTTGKHGTDNRGGFGLPNITIADIRKDTFEFYPPEKHNEAPILFQAYPDFPTTDPKLGFEVNAQYDLGLKSMESGLWKIRRVITDKNGKTYEVEDKFFFIKDAECCVGKMNLQINPSNIHTKQAQFILKLSNLVKVARWGFNCKKFDYAQNIIKFVNLQCKCPSF